MLIRAGGTVGIGNIDIGFGKTLANVGEFPRSVQDLENDDFLFHHVKFFFFQKKEGLGGVVHQKPDHGIVYCIVDGKG